MAETLFYVMPFYDATLRDLLSKDISANERLRLYSTLLDGVEAAHLLGVIHRDLKPENILYDQATQTLVVADFGIARFEQEELYTLVETRPGTRLANFLYAAPEQKVRGQDVGKTADIFALGLILNEMFTKQIPQGTGFRQIGSVDAAFSYLDSVVESMIRHDPADRLESVDVVKVRLIGERNNFVSRQKLDQLTKAVVSRDSIDDPILRDPIRPIDLEVAENGVVFVILNRQPPQKWIDLYRDMAGVSYFMGADFRKFPISDGRIAMRSHNQNEYQQLIEQTKAGIIATNQSYENFVRAEGQQRLADEKRRIQEAVDADKRRQQLRGGLRL